MQKGSQTRQQSGASLASSFRGAFMASFFKEQEESLQTELAWSPERAGLPQQHSSDQGLLWNCLVVELHFIVSSWLATLVPPM